MALHPSISGRLSLIEDLPSWRETLADPAVQLRLQEYRTWKAAPALPSVEISDESIPGLHGPIAVRVYRPPSAPQRPRPGLGQARTA